METLNVEALKERLRNIEEVLEDLIDETDLLWAHKASLYKKISEPSLDVIFGTKE